MLKESGDKVSKEEKESIEKAAAEVKEALKGEDLEKIRTSKEALLKASHKLAEQMYKAAAEKQQGAAAGQAAGGAEATNGQTNGKTNGKNGDNVMDAEIVEEGK